MRAIVKGYSCAHIQLITGGFIQHEYERSMTWELNDLTQVGGWVWGVMRLLIGLMKCGRLVEEVW